MRRLKAHQKSLFCQWPSHDYTAELKTISGLLDAHSEILHWVHDDLTANCRQKTGSVGMTAEQVLRAAIIKQQNDWTFEFLAVQSADSQMTRSFLKLNYDENYSKSCLQKNISRIRASTWLKINNHIIKEARHLGIENGRTVCVDSTVVESNIHHPTDSTLLFDCAKVVDRELKRFSRITGKRCSSGISLKAMKYDLLGIINAKSDNKRLARYKSMLYMSRKLLKKLAKSITILERRGAQEGDLLMLRRVLGLLPRIIDQTWRRVIKGEKVASADKVVSIFEPHTDIIVKGQRDVEYGHKVFFTVGKSGLVLDTLLTKYNPSDSEYFLDLIDRQKQLYGKVPRQTSADGGFASEENVEEAKDLGVKDVCFSKRCGLDIEEMCKSAWVLQKLRSFRAGIESVISVLKRAFGLTRALWKGIGGYAAYVHSSVVLYNLMLIARMSLAA